VPADASGAWSPYGHPAYLHGAYGGPRGGGRSSSLVVTALALVAILAGGALFMSGYSLGQRNATQPGSAAADGEVSFQAFWDAYGAITNRYAGGEIDRKALVEGAINGMFEALGDPYSAYLTSEQYRASLQGISGQFEGIGAEISTRRTDGSDEGCSTLGPDCVLVITMPIEGSPAQAAGLLPDDEVLAVDGTSLDGSTVDQARDRIRGEKGTEVSLTIRRDGGAPFDVSVIRDVIVEREVVSRILADGDVGYIAITGFSDNAAAVFVEELTAHLDAGRMKLIVDLRGNPGGFTTAARKVTSQFVGSGPIFWEEDARGEQTPRDADPDGIATDPSIQLAVLVDRGSASASEIVAGAIRDTGRGTLVGETTYGKGTVQQWTPLENDYGGFRLTVAKWLTPDRTWIHDSGIEPDVMVPRDAPPTGDHDADVQAALELLGEGASAAVLQPAA
jgi:carboxyl-terminal processing protease